MDKTQEIIDTAKNLLEQAKFSRDRDERRILINGLTQTLLTLEQVLKETNDDTNRTPSP